MSTSKIRLTISLNPEIHQEIQKRSKSLMVSKSTYIVGIVKNHINKTNRENEQTNNKNK